MFKKTADLVTGGTPKLYKFVAIPSVKTFPHNAIYWKEFSYILKGRAGRNRVYFALAKKKNAGD